MVLFSRFIYVLMLSLDANFCLKCKERGVNDVSLGSGYAYLVEEGHFKSHLAVSSHAIEVRNYQRSIQNLTILSLDEYLWVASEGSRSCEYTV